MSRSCAAKKRFDRSFICTRSRRQSTGWSNAIIARTLNQCSHAQRRTLALRHRIFADRNALADKTARWKMCCLRLPLHSVRFGRLLNALESNACPQGIALDEDCIAPLLQRSDRSTPSTSDVVHAAAQLVDSRKALEHLRKEGACTQAILMFTATETCLTVDVPRFLVFV